MGFWGVGPFENDAAADYVAEIARKGKPSRLRTTLSSVIKARRGDLEDWPAAEGIAAAETVAAARGYPHSKCDGDLLSWAGKSKQAQKLSAVAKKSRRLSIDGFSKPCRAASSSSTLPHLAQRRLSTDGSKRKGTDGW
jgi:hypothetical protein